MGNNPSNPSQHGYYDSEELRKLMKETRNKLHQTKIEGIMARDAREEEIYELQMKLYEKKKLLMKKAKQIQDSYSFTDYINIIQTTYTSEKIAIKPVQTIIPDDGVRPKTTDIVPQHFKLTYTIFAWFEAYLLKRLHLAMLQRKQQSIHSKSWSGVVADLYFEIPQLKKSFESKLGGLFMRKQNVEMEKHQKYDAYATHVRTQANAIMKLEKASWDMDPLNQSRRLSLPKMISIHEGSDSSDQQLASGRNSPSDALALASAAGGRMSGMSSPAGARGRLSGSFVTADTDVSDGVSELRREMEQIKESPHHTPARPSGQSNTTGSSGPFDGFESDLSESSEEEDSVYESEVEEQEVEEGDQPSAIAVKALNAQPHRVSTLTVPGDFHWHVDKSKEERERLRREAEVENARLARERIIQKTRELRSRNSFDSDNIDLEKASSGDSNEVERLRRLQEQRKSKEKTRLERAAFKAQRLRDLQNRLARNSGHSAVSGVSEQSTDREKLSSILDRLPEKKKSEEEGDTTTAAASTLSKGQPTKETKKKHKKKKSKTGSADDRSIKSNSSSTRSRKSAKKKSILAAEKRAQAKMAALSQVMTSETLESYVQEKEAAENKAAVEDMLSPGGGESISSRASRRSQRLEATIRKAEATANKKLEELALLSDGA